MDDEAQQQNETVFDKPLINYIDSKNVKIKCEALKLLISNIDCNKFDENIDEYLTKIKLLLKENNANVISYCIELLTIIRLKFKENITHNVINDCIINIIEKGVGCNKNNVKNNSNILLTEMFDIIIFNHEEETINLIDIIYNNYIVAKKAPVQTAYVSTLNNLLIEFGNKKFPIKKFLKYSVQLLSKATDLKLKENLNLFLKQCYRWVRE